MENDILDERSREFLETADQYITEHGHQHVSEGDNKQLVSDQHSLPEEFRIDENGELSHHTTGYYDTSDMLSGNGSSALTEDDHRLASELAAELAQENKSLVDGDHHDDTHLMTSYLYSTDFDLNTNSKHSSQTSNHINNQQIISSENLIEVDASEEDYHAEIQNNLPHKKRFRKRESAPTPMRSIHPKCYKCKQCGEQFNSQSAFTVHRTTVHTPKKAGGRMPFMCDICDKQFTHQIKFFEHLKFHYEPQQSKVIVVTTDSGTSPHHVNYQNHGTQEPTNDDENHYIEESIEEQPELHDLPPLQSYRLTEEESMDTDKHCLFSSDGSILAAQLQQPFPCHLCDRNFRRLKALEIHMASVHPQPATVTVSVKQDSLEEFSDPEDLMEGIRHMVPGVADSESETDEKPIHSWEYNGESNTNHEATMIKSKPEENTCVLNGNCDNGENSRAEHTWEDDTDELEQIMKKNISKSLVCNICKRKFNHRNSLLYHLRSHSGKRPHSCKLCPKSFFSSSALKVHNRLHTGDKPFECEWCGRNFRQWGDLKYHIASLHTESKQFQCEFCGKDFARKYSLIVHRRIHTGEKNYVCEFCKKTFRASSYLQNHRRIHTGEKPYKCETCGKAFRVRSDMRRHTVVHRKDGVNSGVQIHSYDGAQLSGIVTSADMNIHLSKLEVDKDKTTEPDDVKYHDNFSHNSNQLLSADEVSAPLNLNLRAQDDGVNDESTHFGQFNGRQEIMDRDTNTLYVWIPSTTEQLLQSE